jgi:hypothetical protein
MVTKQEHGAAVVAGDKKPRVFCDAGKYVAWTPTREGPARPDYAAAQADLRDMCDAQLTNEKPYKPVL